MSIGSFVTCFAHSKSDCEDRGENGFRFCEVKIWNRTLKVLTIVPQLPHSAISGRYLHAYHTHTHTFTHTHKLLHILPWVKSFLLAFSCFACRTKRDTFFAGNASNAMRVGLGNTGVEGKENLSYFQWNVSTRLVPSPVDGSTVPWLSGCVILRSPVDCRLIIRRVTIH